MTGGAAPKTDYGRLFDTVWRTVDENFYDPSFHGVDWTVVGARYRSRVAAVGDDREFNVLANAMLRELKVSHTNLWPPSSSSARQPALGANFELVDGAQTVTRVSLLSDAWRQGLRPGDVLESPLDALNGPLGSAADIQVRNCGGAGRRVSVRRELIPFPPEQPGWRWTTLSPRPGASIGYLRADRFDDGAADMADSAMADLKDTSGLIIDLRENSGGNASALRLASYFLPPGDAPAVALFARPYLKSLGRSPTAADVLSGPKVVGAYTDAAVFKAVSDHGGEAVFYTEGLGGKRYAQPVVVLIGPNTGSAAEGFAWAMRGGSKARFVGRPTAGALLSSETFPVGDGWKLTIPVQGLWGPQGQDYRDKAITPDIASRSTRKDLCRGGDPDLEKAIDLVGARRP
jgi:carboxyl-terminal processing protease